MHNNIRNLWFGVSLVFAAVLGLFGADFNTGLVDLVTFGSLPNPAVYLSNPAVSFSCGLVFVGLAAFFLGFVGLGVFDGITTAVARSRLNILRKALYGEETPSREAFVDCFKQAPELNAAANRHAETLYVHATRKKQSGTSFSILRSTQTASQSFPVSAIVDHRLMVWFFRVLPAAFVGTGIFAFAAVLAAGKSAGDASMPMLSIAAVALAVSVFGAMIAIVIGRALTGFRHAQIAALCSDIDDLYQPSRESVSLEEVIRASKENAELMASATKTAQEDFRATMQDMTREFSEKLEQNSTAMANNLNDGIKAQAPAISDAVSKALAEPIEQLKTSTEAVTSLQSEEVSNLIKNSLETFVRELKSIVGDEFSQLDQLLKSSAESAERFEKVYSEALTAISDQSASMNSGLIDEFRSVMDALKAEDAERIKAQTESLKEMTGQLTTSVKSVTEGLNDAIKEVATTLGSETREIATSLSTETKDMAANMAAEANRHAERFNSALDRAIKAVESLSGQQLERATEDLSKTAESFGSLHTALENLVTLVTPMMRQVVENQESLLSAIESESSNSRVLSRAASEMSAAAQVSRTTVDRFMALAEVLRETSTNMGRAANNNVRTADAASAVTAAPAPKAKPEKKASKAASGSSFGDAIRQLRSSSSEDVDDLPESE